MSTLVLYFHDISRNRSKWPDRDDGRRERRDDVTEAAHAAEQADDPERSHRSARCVTGRVQIYNYLASTTDPTIVFEIDNAHDTCRYASIFFLFSLMGVMVQEVPKEDVTNLVGYSMQECIHDLVARDTF